MVGYLEVAGAATLWGSEGIFATALFSLGMTPQSVALLRPAIGGGFLLLGAVLFARASLRLSWRGFLLLAGAGGLITAVFQVAIHTSLSLTGVATTIALLYLAPALVIAASGPLLGEWPTRGQVGLAGLSIAGVWLTVAGVRGATVTVTPVGIAWGVLTAAAYAGYTLFGRFGARRYGSYATLLHSTFGACVLLACALPVAGYPIVTPTTARAWTILVLLGFFTLAAAGALYYDALGRIEAGRAAIASTLEPVIAAVLATVLLDQGLAPLGWVGLAMVVAGVAGAYALDRRG